MTTRHLSLVSLALLVAAAPNLTAQKLTATGSARVLWQEVSAYIAEAAADVPSDKYDFRPTPGVRTFGELVAHVAGAEQMFCALALGNKPPAEDAVEKMGTGKEAVVAALHASAAACAPAYAQSDAAAARPLDLFGAKRTRLHALLLNATHDNEHYGNIVTYLRINGMVPPSSKPRPAGK